MHRPKRARIPQKPLRTLIRLKNYLLPKHLPKPPLIKRRQHLSHRNHPRWTQPQLPSNHSIRKHTQHRRGRHHHGRPIRPQRRNMLRHRPIHIKKPKLNHPRIHRLIQIIIRPQKKRDPLPRKRRQKPRQHRTRPRTPLPIAHNEQTPMPTRPRRQPHRHPTIRRRKIPGPLRRHRNLQCPIPIQPHRIEPIKIRHHRLLIHHRQPPQISTRTHPGKRRKIRRMPPQKPKLPPNIPLLQPVNSRPRPQPPPPTLRKIPGNQQRRHSSSRRSYCPWLKYTGIPRSTTPCTSVAVSLYVS